MSLTDADHVPDEKPKPARLKLALALGLGVLGVGIAAGLMYFLAPKQAQQTVREVVKAAEELVKKLPAAASAEESAPDETPAAPKRLLRRLSGAMKPGRTRPTGIRTAGPSARQAQPAPMPAPVIDHSAELSSGVEAAKVRELLGKPDLELYKLEKEHEVEHLVYVNRAENYATSVLVVDGRVATVFRGMPSVWCWR